jgi:hypothetical protein
MVLAGAILACAMPARAQRHIWTVPGTSGATYHAVHWDAATGTILATRGHRVVRIDPIHGDQQEVAEHRWEAPHPDDEQPGPALSALAPGSDGALLLGSNITPGQFREIMVYRCAGEGKARVVQAIAGKAHDRRFQGDDRDARNTGLDPMGLAAGPGGTVFVADFLNGRVHLLRPRPEAGADAGGYSIEAIAGSGAPHPRPNQNPAAFDAAQEAGRHDALKVPLEPASIAVTSDGLVLVADVLDRRVYRLAPRTAPPPAGWTLEVAAGTGWRGPGGEGDADARNTHLGTPLQLVAGTAGEIYLRTGTRIWELAPCLDAEGQRRWRSRRVCVLSRQVTAAPDGSAMTDLPSRFFEAHGGMAAGPWGGLFFTVPGEGIRYLSPPGDAALAERVQAYRQAGDAARKQAIRDSLIRQRDEPAAKVLERPLRFLSRQAPFDAPAGDRPRLPEALRRKIGAFVMDPQRFRFQAALALEAIRADPPGPAP